MSIAYVLIKAAPDSSERVYEALTRLGALDELFPLFGEYDFIAKVETPNYDELAKVVWHGIRKIPGVRSTETLTVTKM